MLNYFKNLNPTKLITIALIVVILYFVIKAVFKQPPPNANYVPGAAIPSNWTPNKVTDLLYNQINGIGITSSNEGAILFNELNDNQVIAVYNDWNKRYAQEKIGWVGPSYGTLTKAISDETYKSDHLKVALNTLYRLKLS